MTADGAKTERTIRIPGQIVPVSMENPTGFERALEIRTRIRLKLNLMFGPGRRKKWKTQVLLPLRNRVLQSRPISKKIAGVRLRLAPVEMAIPEFWDEPRLETSQLKLLLRFLEPGEGFLDAYSGMGLFAIAIAKKLGPDCVHAFEPSQERFQILRTNLELNGLADHLAVDRTALGNHVGETLLSDDSWRFDEVYWTHQQCSANGRPSARERAPVTTLDALVESQAIGRIDAIRLQAGGAELAFIEGAQKTLQRADGPLVLCPLSVVQTSQFSYHPVEILWSLADYGYTIYRVNSETGLVSRREPDGQYNGVILAAKTAHLPRLRSIGYPV
jgi:FkbM family methyltransferase